MLKSIGTAGEIDKKNRSDCFVRIELHKNGGINIHLKSKVKANYEKTILSIVHDILKFFDINNCDIKIIDYGALDFVLSARIEAAIKKIINTKKEYLLPFMSGNNIETKKDIFRFSRLYLPGNSPKLMINAGLHKPNGVILDLEDSISFDKKIEARFIVRNALRSLNFYGAERMVRINQGELAYEDLKFVIPQKPNVILYPKCESTSQIISLNKKISEHNKDNHQFWIMPIIESATGIENAYEIAKSADNIIALAIGLEDYTADIGVQRTENATESFYARTKLVNVCRAAGIQAIDSVFSDINNMDALAKNVKISKSLGFDGMGCIHPRQIKVIHKNYAPSEKEIDNACKIINAFNYAKKKRLGVVSLGTKMIDAPVVKRAERTVDLAITLGLLKKNWLDFWHAN